MAVQLGSAYGKVELDAKGVQTGSKQAQDAIAGLGDTMNEAFSFTLGGLAAQGIGLLVGGMRDLYGETKSLATGFESQMAIMSTAVDPSVASLIELKDVALRVGGDLDLVGIDASQAAVAMTDMFKSGMTVNEVFGDMEGYMAGTAKLGGVLRGSIDLQAASALDLAQANALVNSTLTTYGLSTEEASRVTDNFVKTADASKAEVGDLAAAHQNAAIVMASFKYSMEDTNTALGLLSQQALKGADAGTALRSMMNNMLRPTSDAKNAWAELNVALYDSEGNLRRLPDIIGDMVPALQNVTEERRNELVYILAGSDGQRALNILLGQGATGWSNMETAIAGASSAQDIAAVRVATLKGAEEALAGSVETLKIQVGDQFIPVWTQMATEMGKFVTDVGPSVIGIAGGVATAFGGMVTVFTAIPGPLSATIVQMTALTTVLGGGYMAVVKLTPVVVAMGPVLNTAAAGWGLYTSGASLAEVATLGVTASLVPIAIGLGVVAAALIAVNAGLQLYNDIQEKTAQTDDQWAGKLSEIAARAGSARDVTAAYATKQAELSQVFEDNAHSGNILKMTANALIDKEEILMARGEDLNAAMVQAADGYEDYASAAEEYNLKIQEQATYYDGLGQKMINHALLAERGIVVMDAETFALQREKLSTVATTQALGQYGLSLQGAAAADAALQQAQTQTTLTTQQQAALYTQMTGLLGQYNLGKVEATAVEQQLGVAMGQTTQLQAMQADALNVLTAGYASGALTLDAYSAAGAQVALVNQNTPEGFAAVAAVVASATGNYAALGGTVEGLPGAMAGLSEAASQSAINAEEMSKRSEDAWKTFASSVATGVGSALQAYKDGNAEMLKEQQDNLARMLVGQTDQMLAMGQITGDQATEMKSAISKEFGIMVNTTQLTTDKLLGMFADWSSGGTTTSTQIVDFIQNIGEESETLTSREKAAIDTQITDWENLKTRVGDANDRMAERMEGLGTDTETATGRAATAFAVVGPAADEMAGQVTTASTTATTALGTIQKAIIALPAYKEIEIHVKRTGDQTVPLGPDLTDKVDTQSVTPAWVTDATVAQVGLGAVPAVPLGSSPAPMIVAAGRSPRAPAPPVTLNMPVTLVGNAVDVELLARQVVTLIQRYR